MSPFCICISQIEIEICRFRRDVLEGTLEEMLEPEIVEKDSEEEEQIPERWLLR